MPDTRHERVRKKFHILVDGEGIPAPIKSFREMKFPPGLSHTLKTLFLSDSVVHKWQHLSCECSHSKRFKKERDCSSDTDSDPRNPHSVSSAHQTNRHSVSRLRSNTHEPCLCSGCRAETWSASPSLGQERLWSLLCRSLCLPWSRRRGCLSSREKDRTDSSSVLL